jgi:DNA-binding winged helix-turn-helix (wHTH) protein
MKWRIGEWVACSDTDTVRNATVQHKLERRAMEALVLLAERAGQVVKKDELIETVWRRLAVSDHSVAMVVSQLRRALHDNARAPRYIETITKRGYRLIAPCEALAEPLPRLAQSAPVAGAQSRPAQMTTMLVSAGVALAGAGALSALLLL